MSSSYERETTINASDGDELVRIWTAQRRYITRLRRDRDFTEVASGTDTVSDWAEFTIPADRWSPAGVKRRKNYSSAAKIEAGKRLAASRGRS